VGGKTVTGKWLGMGDSNPRFLIQRQASKPMGQKAEGAAMIAAPLFWERDTCFDLVEVFEQP